MFTKEELLEKGVSESAADEIIAAYEEDTFDNPLLSLEKALSDKKEESGNLFKASDEDEDDEDEGDEDEKEESESMKKDAKEACKKMKKAVDDFDMESTDTVLESADVTPVLEAQAELNSVMQKAVSATDKKIEVLSAKVDKMFDLMQKAARLSVEQAKASEIVLSQSQGRKGVVSTEMTKATNPFSLNDANIVYSALIKATQNGDAKAGMIVSGFEAHGKDVSKLKENDRRYISELLSKEGK